MKEQICRVGWMLLLIGVTVAVPGAVFAEEPAAEKPEVKFDMSKGGLTVSSGDNSVSIGTLIQFRYTLDDREAFDADTAGDGDGIEDGASGSFLVRRARLILKGGMFKPWLKYQLQVEFAGTKGTDANNIKDAYLEFVPSSLASIKTGQFKVPFSLQELTSSSRQEFADRAITNLFAPSRDLGVAVSGVTEEKFFGYAAGVFNGGGEGKLQDDQGYLYAGRVWFDPLGEYKLSETAVDAVQEPVVHIGLGARTGEAVRGFLVAGVFENPDNQTAYNLEFAYRQAFFFATAEYFLETTERENPTPGPDVDAEGYHAQVGFMVLPKTLEIALRYAAIDPDQDLDDDDLTEARIGVSYFWKAHNLKVMADYGEVTIGEGFTNLPSTISPRFASIFGSRLVSGEELTDKVFRAQIQLAF